MAFKNAYYKYLFLILLFISQNLYAQNPNPKGVTIITHGFQATGNLSGNEWVEFAAAIKKELEMELQYIEIIYKMENGKG